MESESSSPTVPTASSEMFKSSGVSSALHSKKSARHRSKSESVSAMSISTNGTKVDMKVSSDKNDRKPRNLKGTGKPKKDGAGGKGTWGKNGVIYDEFEEKDPNDPNFKEELSPDIVMHEVVQDLTSPEFDKVARPAIKEYFMNGIGEEVVDFLAELSITHIKHQVVYLTVVLSFDEKARERELVSRLLSLLCSEHIISAQDLEFGFQALLNAVKDISIDVPEASKMLGTFMARAIADDILPASFIKEHRLPEIHNQAREDALLRVEAVLKHPYGLVHADTIWGVSGGDKPVKALTKQIDILIKEYFNSLDVNEVARCIRDLDVPHFHHEIVYEALLKALDDIDAIGKVIAMLKFLYDSGVLSVDQLTMGFTRIFSNIDDIKLDSPRAYKYLDEVVNQCCRHGIITPMLRQKAPTQGRKRYMSEGDFGLTKHPIEHAIIAEV